MALNNRSFPRIATRFNRLLVKLSVLPAYSAPSLPMMVIQTAAGSTGDALQIQDSTGAVTYSIGATGRPGVGKSTTITDASATSLADVAIPASAMVGGVLHYTVRASDATPDFQALTGMVTYAGVNKAGALTLVITELATVQAKAVSAGTLTLAWTFVAGTNKGTIKLQPTGSLTETFYDCTFAIIPIQGAVTAL